jgi:hypothetical protein
LYRLLQDRLYRLHLLELPLLLRWALHAITPLLQPATRRCAAVLLCCTAAQLCCC